MRINNWSGAYFLGYGLISVGCKTYFKNFEVQGIENIPKNKPILFAANHQNAFLDAVVIANCTSQPIYFLGRADIFKKKIVCYLLNSFNFVPIYRKRDGISSLVKNEDTFEKCYHTLKKNRSIVIFPEGNHDKKQQLRPLTKGVFRIGFGAENRFDDKIDVHIVPVGINYSKHSSMGGNCLVNFGEPLKMRDYLEVLEENQPIALNKLKSELANRIKSSMIDISDEYYSFIKRMLFIMKNELIQLENQNGKGLFATFKAEKGCIDKLEILIHSNTTEADEIRNWELAFSEGLKKHRLRAWLFESGRLQPVLVHFMVLLLLSPVHIYGIINNYLPYRIPAWFADKKIKDVHFHSSIKMTLGTVLFTLFWIIQFILVAWFTELWISLLYLISLPVSAYISNKYWNSFLKLRGKLNFNKLAKNDNKEYRYLKGLFEQLRTYLKKAY